MFASKLQTQNENKVNFKMKTHAELQELYERQRKILSNGYMIYSRTVGNFKSLLEC